MTRSNFSTCWIAIALSFSRDFSIAVVFKVQSPFRQQNPTIFRIAISSNDQRELRH